MNKLLLFIKSHPAIWGLSLAGIIGILSGLSLFTFSYARGTSYLLDDPQACANCHVMRDQFNAWERSSHANVATCNDCHTPHEFLGKWIIKALNGFNHSVAFTLNNFPDPIRIHTLNADVAQENCVRCHQSLVGEVLDTHSGEALECVECHGSVGHRTRD
jgi:cytochrome c nitrite reductase small subunit